MQPAICEDVVSHFYRLLNSFVSLQTAPNTFFSHHGGFQMQPQQPHSVVSADTIV